MDSGSSAAGGPGSRVAPSERAPLPPLVGERNAEAFAECGVTVDPAARVAQTAQLLPGTTVGARAVVADMCVVGPNALVFEGARLDAWCVVGDRAVIGPGADIGSTTSIDADCTVGRDAVFGSAVQVAPGVAIREGLRVEGPQAVWADHPAAVSADPVRSQHAMFVSGRRRRRRRLPPVRPAVLRPRRRRVSLTPIPIAHAERFRAFVPSARSIGVFSAGR